MMPPRAGPEAVAIGITQRGLCWHVAAVWGDRTYVSAQGHDTVEAARLACDQLVIQWVELYGGTAERQEP
jgi:hypothetical protein